LSQDILPAITNQALEILRLGEDGNTRYTVKTLESYVMDKYIRDCRTIGAHPNLSLAQMNAFVVHYPCFEEQ
jgi:hypothetical protein